MIARFIKDAADRDILAVHAVVQNTKALVMLNAFERAILVRLKPFIGACEKIVRE
jgi:hypothetical protein